MISATASWSKVALADVGAEALVVVLEGVEAHLAQLGYQNIGQLGRGLTVSSTKSIVSVEIGMERVNGSRRMRLNRRPAADWQSRPVDGWPGRSSTHSVGFSVTARQPAKERTVV